jgi:hypothetical protein
LESASPKLLLAARATRISLIAIRGFRLVNHGIELHWRPDDSSSGAFPIGLKEAWTNCQDLHLYFAVKLLFSADSATN